MLIIFKIVNSYLPPIRYYLFMYLSVYLFNYLFIYLSIYLFIYLLTYLLIYLFTYLFNYRSIQFIFSPPLCPSPYLLIPLLSFLLTSRITLVPIFYFLLFIFYFYSLFFILYSLNSIFYY